MGVTKISFQEACKRLNISTNCGAAQAKKAYYRLTLKTHPDKNKSADAKEQQQKLNEAYEVIERELNRAANNSTYNYTDSGSSDDDDDVPPPKKPRYDYDYYQHHQQQYQRQQQEREERERKEREKREREQREEEQRKYAEREKQRKRAADNKARLERMIQQEWERVAPESNPHLTQAQLQAHMDNATEIKDRLADKYFIKNAALQRGDVLTDDFEILIQYKIAVKLYEFYREQWKQFKDVRYDKYRRYCVTKMPPVYRRLWSIWVAHKELKSRCQNIIDFVDSKGVRWSGEGAMLKKQEADAYLDLVVDNMQTWNNCHNTYAQKCKDMGWLVMSKKGDWVLTMAGIDEANKLWG